MIAAYVAAWTAIARGHAVVPWMALALFVFSMTTLYPVHYLYYDVVLLIACAAIAAVRAPLGTIRMATSYSGTVVALTILVIACLAATTSRLPDIAVGGPSTDRVLRGGFSGIEHDGARGFAWIVGHEARLAIARGSSGDADLVLAAESALGPQSPLQHVTGILNGIVVADTDLPAGPSQLRIPVPHGAWWTGFNDLHLVFSSAVSPHDAGTGDDRRPLAMAVSRVSVVSKQP
jgi:hypothetical protein